MAVLWATKLQPAPKLPPGFLLALLPVALFHTVGHVSACVSFSQVAVSFAHIVKSAEPVFSVLLSGPILGTTSPWYVWASLLPIVAGCSLSAMKELSFTWGGFNYAMVSNVGMVLRNIYSKKQLNDFKVLVFGVVVCVWFLAFVLQLKRLLPLLNPPLHTTQQKKNTQSRSTASTSLASSRSSPSSSAPLLRCSLKAASGAPPGRRRPRRTARGTCSACSRGAASSTTSTTRCGSLLSSFVVVCGVWGVFGGVFLGVCDSARATPTATPTQLPPPTKQTQNK